MVKLKDKDFRVAVYGSARIKKNDPIYKMVYKLGRMIGHENLDLVTGGGPGLMEAATAGHNSAKGKCKVHSIGLNIKLPKEQKNIMGLDVRVDFNRFSKRLDNFMSLSNAFVVTPGGVGTVLELFYTWQLMQVKHTCNVPLILLGDMWPGLIKWMENSPLKENFLSAADMSLLFIAKTPEEAMKMIRVANKEYKSGNKNFCLNYTKYKLY